MSVMVRKPRMTREAFFDWAHAQDARYEFDGCHPVATTGGSINHSQTTQNILLALRTRLGRSACRPLGPDAGVATIGDAVRYPDALVTCAKLDGTARVVPGVVVVFEVISPASGLIDRIDELREYRAVASVRRYVTLEHASVAVTVFQRDDGESDWTATALTASDVLRMPEIGIEVPVAEFYENVELPPSAGSPGDW